MNIERERKKRTKLIKEKLERKMIWKERSCVCMYGHPLSLSLSKIISKWNFANLNWFKTKPQTSTTTTTCMHSLIKHVYALLNFFSLSLSIFSNEHTHIFICDFFFGLISNTWIFFLIIIILLLVIVINNDEFEIFSLSCCCCCWNVHTYIIKMRIYMKTRTQESELEQFILVFSCKFAIVDYSMFTHIYIYDVSNFLRPISSMYRRLRHTLAARTRA